MRQQRQAGVVVEGEGKRRRDVEPVVIDEVGLGARVLRETDQPPRRPVAAADDALEIEGALEEVVAAELALHLAAGPEGRALADDVDEPAGRHLPVEDRGRPLQHLDALGAPGLDLRLAAARAVRVDQAVDEGAAEGREAADALGPIGAVGGGRHREDPGGVAERVAHRLRPAPLRDLVRRDDADRARRLDQRRVGLAAGGARLGDDAVDRAGRRPGGAGDGDRVEHERCVRLGEGEGRDRYKSRGEARAGSAGNKGSLQIDLSRKFMDLARGGLADMSLWAPCDGCNGLGTWASAFLIQ